MKILIIDDDQRLRDALRMMIESLGGEVETTGTADEGLRCLRNGHYDYVLLDIKMPQRDGMWFIRNARIPSDTKLIAMSGFMPGVLLKEMYRLGVSDFLEKPFDADELLNVFDRCAQEAEKKRMGIGGGFAEQAGPRRTAVQRTDRPRSPDPSRIYHATFNAVIQGRRD